MARLDFAGAVETLGKARSVAVCAHVNPDGDALGSVLALTLALQGLGFEATPLLASRDLPQVYRFLAGYDQLTPACDYKGAPDVFIAVDVPAVDRMGDGARVFERAGRSIVIDHHQGDGSFATCAIVDEEAAAAGILVWDFIERLGAERTADIATCCYTALVTDTGRFQFQNADERAFAAAAEMVAAGADPAQVAMLVYQSRSLASLELDALVIQRLKFLCGGRVVYSWVSADDFKNLGALEEDGEGLIDVIRAIDGAEVAVMLREQGPVVRGSIRSKSDRDVSVIARGFGGGGHRGAAGFTIHKNIEAARRDVIAALEADFAEGAGGETGA